MADRDLAFENVLSGGRAEKRTALIVFPAVVILALLIGFAAVSISRTSALTTEVQNAKNQLAEANKVVEERDAQLRDARADIAVLSTPGQGAAVLAAVKKENGASGVARIHPERHALAVYAYNLAAAPEGQEYRVIVSDPERRETLLGALTPDDRGAAALLVRDVPEGASAVEVALVPKAAAGQGQGQGPGAKGGAGGPTAGAAAPAAAPAQRQPILAGTLPKPGEAGVVAASAEAGPRVQARSAGGSARRGR
ncbi:hypothetical protein [Anaeromyxobacter diazotrophicus]|uniref:Uncharacterized protein n=1 Tax=Anaeromyxobacter diazotrophicus TaxID=2590199 RepID=A0A7I9VRH2_9BACT|nr:hypothetical protein [Anaeromyxobacter diazotrophicus]GEJ59034.1 hypothetical protein AMYX_37750 [Anaeromyxobacter diazotrophicus]